jgi:NADH:ubiquinone oxidoreductase subunit
LNIQFEILIELQITSAVFWECKPFTLSSISTDTFECVFLWSPPLDRISPDPSHFKSYFKQNQSGICVFQNLSGDAVLISPTPTKNGNFAHFATFHKTATMKHIHEFWKQIGTTAEEVVRQKGNKPVWMSTSGVRFVIYYSFVLTNHIVGLGVSWLHVRFDSTPKYYSYTPFRNYQPLNERFNDFKLL